MQNIDNTTRENQIYTIQNSCNISLGEFLISKKFMYLFFK